jgi:hypothetical protein
MATIPLPALHTAPIAQPESPLHMMGQMMGIQGAQQEQQLREQEMQTRQIEQQEQQLQLQQQQQAMKDQQTFRTAMQAPENHGKTIGDIADTLANQGAISPQGWQQMKKADIEQRTALATMDEKTLANASAAHKATQELYNNVMDMPDEQLAANWPSIAQQYDAIPGNNKMPLDPSQPLTKDQLQQFGPMLSMHGAYIEEATERQKKQAELAAKKAENEFYAQNGGAPGVPAEMMQQADWLKKNPGKGPADFLRYKAAIAPTVRFNLEANGMGEGPLNPQQAATAQAIVEGRQTAPTGFALSTPYWQRVMGGVTQLDPQWSEQRAQLRKDFTVGKHSSEINAINTAMGHVGVLGDAIDALQNGNVQVLNRIANSIGAQVGSDSQTTFNTIVHRVGPEIAKAYIGAGGSAGERGADEKDFDPALGPQQLKSNVSMTAKLLRSKIAAFENQWDQNKSEAMPSFQERFIMPEAQQQLNKWAPAAAKQPAAPPAAAGAPQGASQEVWKDGKLIGHVVGNRYVPLGSN